MDRSIGERTRLVDAPSTKHTKKQVRMAPEVTNASERKRWRERRTPLVVRRKTSRISFRLCFAITLVAGNELLALNLILPFARDLVLSLGVGKDWEGIATSLLTGAYGLGQCLSARFWGQLSDLHGRRPIMFMSSFASAASIACLGLAPSFNVAVAVRFGGGVCNGLMAVLKSAVSEIVTDAKGQSRCFALLQIASSAGAIVGPTLGGLLVQKKNSAGGVGSEHRFLAPCVACAMLQLVLASAGVGMLPKFERRKSDPDDFHVPDQVIDALQKRAMDGDTVEVQHVSKPKRPSLAGAFDQPPQPSTDPEEEEESNTTVLVYDTGEERRFKFYKPPRLTMGFAAACTINAISAMLDECANVSEALVLPSPKDEGGAGLPEYATGLVFGAAGFFMLVYVVIGLPSLERFLGGSYSPIFCVGEMAFALSAILFPMLCAVPEPPLIAVKRNKMSQPQIPFRDLAVVILLGCVYQCPPLACFDDDGSCALSISLTGLNSASATALIAANVLVQQALAGGDALGRGNGVAQSAISGGRILGPFLAGVAYDFAGRVAARRASASGPFVCICVGALLAAFIARSVSSKRSTLHIEDNVSNRGGVGEDPTFV